MRWTVYILLLRDGTLYTGITTDLARRVAQHDSGRGARYTRGRGVQAIHYTERKRTMSSALKREAAIKKLSRAAKLALGPSEEVKRYHDASHRLMQLC